MSLPSYIIKLSNIIDTDTCSDENIIAENYKFYLNEICYDNVLA
jgi:hypothetical protein